MKYVYKCIKNQTKTNQFGLCLRKRYKCNDYISYDGVPVKDLNDAFIFDNENGCYMTEFPKYDNYFKKIEIKLIERK